MRDETSGSGVQPLTGCVTWTDPSAFYYRVIEPPKDCSGDVHVFPCPHCATCKCGQATMKRGKK